MLSFLKPVQIWPKNVVLNLALCCSAIWRHREKLQYRCTTTIHPVYNSWKKVLENLLPVGLLVRTNLLILGHFWTSHTKFDSCCLHYVAIFQKILYRCTSTVSALYCCSRIFFLQILQLSIRSGAHKLFCRFFGLFAIFNRNFAKIVAPPNDEYEN